jgi:hypothetical protein
LLPFVGFEARGRDLFAAPLASFARALRADCFVLALAEDVDVDPVRLRADFFADARVDLGTEVMT